MASDAYAALAGGRDIYGRPWEIGLRRGVMVVKFGEATRVFDDEQGDSDGGAVDRDRFAGAVARAVAPEQPTPRHEPGQPKETSMTPTIGRIVHYKLSAGDAGQINRRREDFAEFNRANRATAAGPGEFPGRSGHIGHYGNPVSEGDVYPATVVRIFSPGSSTVNLQVQLDGNDAYWATSRSEGDGPGFWSWPPRA